MGKRFDTDAERERDDAVCHIKEAIDCLAKIVIGQCKGYDEYNKYYHGLLSTSLNQLVEMRNELDVR